MKSGSIFYVFVAWAPFFNLARQTAGTGYFWRDYEKEIPQDAFRGGSDRKGGPIYIGQVLHDNKLIPGKIYANNSDIYYRWEYERSTDQNVKILCSLYPNNFEWISTTVDQVVRLTDKFLVKGGYEPGYFTYIGRIFAGGETTVGKVICKLTECLNVLGTAALYFSGPFEILSYKLENLEEDSNNPTAMNLTVSVQ